MIDGNLQNIFCPFRLHLYLRKLIASCAPQIADLAQHREDSPGYTKAIISLLLHMKEEGVDINEMGVQGVSRLPMMLCQM